MDYKDLDKRFESPDINFTTQYCGVYSHRLQETRKLFPHVKTVTPIVDLKEPGKQVTILGTLFKKQDKRKSVIDFFANEYVGTEVIEDKIVNFCSSEDELFLEDESGRVRLMTDEAQRNMLSTGIVLAVSGKIDENDDFEAAEFIFAKLQSPKQIPHKQNSNYVMLIGGINLQLDYNEKNILPLALVAELVREKPVSRVILCGNNFVQSLAQQHLTFAEAHKDITKTKQENLAENITLFDTFIGNLLDMNPNLYIDLMPGENDLSSSVILPQKRINGNALLSRMQFGSRLHHATNPHECLIGSEQVHFLGESGNIQKNLQQHTKFDNPLDLAKAKLLQWGNIAPNCPDTMTMYPFTNSSPFVQKTLPNVYFTAGASKFQSEFTKDVRFIQVPNFSSTREVVLVDINKSDLSTASIAIGI